MKAVLRLELIGDDSYSEMQLMRRQIAAAVGNNVARQMFEGMGKHRPWVARIVGTNDRWGLQREFQRPQSNDYEEANSVGSRGVYALYILAPGMYEVHERKTWKRSERYFLRVTEDGEKEEITREEVLECLSDECSASTS